MTKSLFTVFIILIFQLAPSAQEIPNHSFEIWSDGDPVDWLTTDVIGFDAVSQSSDAYEGSSSAYLEILGNVSGVFLPSLQVSDGLGGIGTPVTQRYSSFGGYYKFTKVGSGNESFVVQINMIDFNTTTLIGSGVLQFPPASNWTEFNVPITYISEDTPDRAILFMTITDFGGQGTVGSNAHVDYVMFGSPNDVEQLSGLPVDYSLSQNYPNPFNPTTNIEYSIPEQSYVELKVYDILGNEVATLVNEEQPAGTYRADFDGKKLSSGLYIAQLSTGSKIQTIKMSLLK